MKKLKAKQKAKGTKELSAEEAEQVTGGCHDFPVETQPYPTPGFPGIVTLGINEDGRTNPIEKI